MKTGPSMEHIWNFSTYNEIPKIEPKIVQIYCEILKFCSKLLAEDKLLQNSGEKAHILGNGGHFWDTLYIKNG